MNFDCMPYHRLDNNLTRLYLLPDPSLAVVDRFVEQHIALVVVVDIPLAVMDIAWIGKSIRPFEVHIEPVGELAEPAEPVEPVELVACSVAAYFWRDC